MKTPFATTHDKKLSDLRARLARREMALAEDLLHGPRASKTHDIWPTGWEQLDAGLAGGLRRGALNELCLEEESIGALEALLPALLRAPTDRREEDPTGLWAWVHPERQLYPPALAAAGLPLDRFVAVRPRDLDEQLWALESLLDAGSCALVASFLDRVSDTALRRLQLAARRGGSAALLLRPGPRAATPSPAPIRIRAQPLRSTGRVAPASSGEDRRALVLEIFKRPGLRAPESFVLEWSPDALDARPLLRLRDRPLHPHARGRGAGPAGPVPHRA